jgi:hypothetical protein
MGVRNRDREVIERLDSKTLDARFTTEIEQGLNCSPFEAEAVLDVVKEVYFPFLSAEAAEPAPGKISLIAVAADEPAGKPIVNCQKQAICLTLHRGKIDDLLFQQHGPAGFRQARILDLCQQALSQGALLTAEDLAYRVFFVTPRTISRDLIMVRQANPNVGTDLGFGSAFDRLVNSAQGSCSQGVDETVYLSVLFSVRRSFGEQRSGFLFPARR